MTARPAIEAGEWSHSEEAEQSLLGALLLSTSGFEEIARLVAPADFFTAEHGHIFSAISAITQRGWAVDTVTVTDWLRGERPEAFAAMGGIAYLGGLSQNCPSSAHAIRYAQIVRNRSLCRRLDSLGLELSEAARTRAGRDLETALSMAQIRVAKLLDATAPASKLRALAACDLVACEIPELEPLLLPWLFQKNLVMVHAKRGVGKTHFALAVAFAVASGTAFLGWRAPKSREVLYIDGEMPQQLMQRRLRELTSAHGESPEMLRIVTPDDQDRPMPDLGTPTGQAEIDALVRDETALIIVDNLSCLVRSGGAENESESWTAVSEWALRHRRAGRAVLFVHHSGKSGVQRGTSKREDLLDVVINLRHPSDYREADGAVFAIHFEKARSLTGEEIAPLQAKLETGLHGGQVWTSSAATTLTKDQIKALWEIDAMTILDIARELGCNKSHVARTLQAAMDAGELKRSYPSRPRGKAK